MRLGDYSQSDLWQKTSGLINPYRLQYTLFIFFILSPKYFIVAQTRFFSIFHLVNEMCLETSKWNFCWDFCVAICNHFKMRWLGKNYLICSVWLKTIKIYSVFGRRFPILRFRQIMHWFLPSVGLLFGFFAVDEFFVVVWDGADGGVGHDNFLI